MADTDNKFENCGDRTLLGQIREAFGCGDKDANSYSPLALAYIGDDVFDMIIRTMVVERANRPAHELHLETVRFVKAKAQAEMIEELISTEGFLTEKELEIYRRGRNAKSYTSAKNASIHDYRKATGFEALLGYLYLSGEQERVIEIVHRAVLNEMRKK